MSPKDPSGLMRLMPPLLPAAGILQLGMEELPLVVMWWNSVMLTDLVG